MHITHVQWTTTALNPSILAGEWDLVVIRAGFQVEKAAHAKLGTKGIQGRPRHIRKGAGWVGDQSPAEGDGIVTLLELASSGMHLREDVAIGPRSPGRMWPFIPPHLGDLPYLLLESPAPVKGCCHPSSTPQVEG